MPNRSDGQSDGAEFEAGWEATRRRQLTLGLTGSPAQRLRWLEEMLVIAHRSGALERRRRDKVRTCAGTLSTADSQPRRG